MRLRATSTSTACSRSWRACAIRERGCPWDVQQTFATIAPYTIEEAYEVADAIDRDDLPALKDELGDLLLQVVFHARMAEEQGAFAFDDVVAAISDKMVRRHPHVFADASVEDAEAQTARLGRAQAPRARSRGPRGHLRARRHRPRPAGMAARGEAAEARGHGRLRLAGHRRR